MILGRRADLGVGRGGVGWNLQPPSLSDPDLQVGLNNWPRCEETHWRVSGLTWGKGANVPSPEVPPVADLLVLDASVAIWLRMGLSHPRQRSSGTTTTTTVSRRGVLVSEGLLQVKEHLFPCHGVSPSSLYGSSQSCSSLTVGAGPR